MSGISATNGMRQNKIIGLILLVVPSFFFIFFSYLLLFTEWDILVIKTTLIIFVGILMSVLIWMGYTMVTAPREK
jgi:CHASE2 domain-containing sensor protein